MNLVVIAQQAEDGEHGAAIISQLTGRHPSRTMILSSADPDGPGWLDARITAQCILPRADAPETCAETIYITAGGDTGRHLAAIVEPLLIHDLPVTVWWPGEARLESQQARDVLASADRLVVDGSAWRGDGLARLRELARVADDHPDGRLRLRPRPPVALARGDRLDLRHARVPALPALAAPGRGDLRDPRRERPARPRQPGQAALSRRLARLAAGPDGGQAARPGARHRRHRPGPGSSPRPGRGYAATLRQGNADIAVVIRPVLSSTAAGHDPAGRAALRAARLRAPGRRHRRGRIGRRPGLAGRRRDPRPAVQCRPPDRGRPAGRGDRGRRPRPGLRRCRPDGRPDRGPA